MIMASPRTFVVDSFLTLYTLLDNENKADNGEASWEMTTKPFKLMIVIAAAFAAASAARAESFKLGIVTFMSGPAAESQGIPAWRSAEMLAKELNAGALPKPYDKPGFGGIPVEVASIDEAGSTTKQVQDLRNGYERDGFDAVVGYTSSSNCLAVSPVAEEMKKLLILYTCGTPRIFEESKYQYVFRNTAHATMDNVALVFYVRDRKIAAGEIAAINPDYAYGRDNWKDFSQSLQKLEPSTKIKSELWPKLGAGQYGTEISSLLQANTPAYYSVLWGGDLQAFLLQAAPRGLLKDGRHIVVPDAQHVMQALGNRMPENVITGARGEIGPFASKSALNDWLLAAIEKYMPGSVPQQSHYRMVQSILGLKAAFEKAMAANGGKRPTTEQIAAALTGSQWESPSGLIKMALGDGHQAIQAAGVGTTRINPATKVVEISDIKHFAAECVNPPPGVKAEDWIAQGFPGAKCK
jgi:branched-chain amino acid transport system substrate-binding protein